MKDEAVRELARLAGIANDWIDAADRPRRVAIGPLRAILSALGYPCESAADLAESRARLTGADGARAPRPLVTATVGEPVRLARLRVNRSRSAEIVFEDGRRAAVRLRAAPERGSIAPAIDQPGYHRLHCGEDEIVLAVAPRRCVTVNDIAPGERLWGLAAQIYSLRRAGDGGIGDTTALQSLAESAAAMAPRRSRSAPRTACFRPIRPATAPIRRRAGSFSIRFSPIPRRCSAMRASRRR